MAIACGEDRIAWFDRIRYRKQPYVVKWGASRGSTMKEWLLVLKAADAAARWHVHQRRKGPAEEPYINHLVEVAMLVADATGGNDTNLVIAALLHDAIEDCEVPRELITETLGMISRRLLWRLPMTKASPKPSANSFKSRPHPQRAREPRYSNSPTRPATYVQLPQVLPPIGR